MDPTDPTQLFRESRELTRRGLDEAKRAAEPEPDLVAWGETMLPTPVLDPSLERALQSGARPDPWSLITLDEERLRFWREIEANWVGEALFGRSGTHGILPPGAVFVAGAEHLTAEGGRIRRQNAVFLWASADERSEPVAKLHLVPGAETMLGLERWASVRSVIHQLAGYVPDLLEARPNRVLSLVARDGRRFAFGASVCFDNAFDDPYTKVLREQDLDFHLVVSNEAWFRSSQEADQMMAFSHLIAIETGRAMVRATNSGISAVIDAEGREVARLVVLGRDREVRGTLRATVPVPRRPRPTESEPSAADPGTSASVSGAQSRSQGKTPFVRWERWWLGLWIALPALLFLIRPRPQASNRNPTLQGG